MNAKQREYFRRKLVDWKEDIIKGTKETVIGLQNESVQHPDDVDCANSEAEKQLELRTCDRHRKLINKIDWRCAALKTRLTAIARKPASRSA